VEGGDRLAAFEDFEQCVQDAGPLERLYGHDRKRLDEEIRRVVLHEVAHHFGISDARLIEIDRY